MIKGLKQTLKTILAWVLALAMTFANVEPVSAAMVSVEDVTAEVSGTQEGEDVTEGDVTDGDVTDGDVTDGDVSEGNLNILDSGEWHGITWELTLDGVLTIGGEDTNAEAEKMYHWDTPWYNYRESVVEAVVTAESVKSTRYWFYECKNLTKVDFSGFDTSQLTDIAYMFYACSSLEKLDMSKWDVSNVTDMRGVFSWCSSLKELNISKWDVRNVTNMASMFSNSDNLTRLDLSKWNMNSVTNMQHMFYDCAMLTEVKLGNANGGTLQDLSDMFHSCQALKKVHFGKMNTSNVSNVSYMFSYCKSLESLNLSGFDTGNVTTMECMFENCEQLKTLSIEGFNTGNVTNMAAMFYECKKVKELNLSSFNTSNVTDMNHMCYGCNSLTELDFSGFDISKAEKMAGMAHGCENLGRVKVFVNLQRQVALPQYSMSDIEGKYYNNYYPTGLTESIWLYFKSPNAQGNIWVKEIAPQVYTGKAIKPEVVVYNGWEVLKEKVDYTFSYKNNTKANDATNEKIAPSIIVKGKGNYSGQDVVTFQILPRDLMDEDVKTIVTIANKANGKVQKPIPVITYNGKKLVNKKDFTVSYPDLEDETITDAYKAPGTYRILVTGKGNFSGEREITFVITESILMSKVKIAPIGNQAYTGSKIEPEVAVTYGKTVLVKDTDYAVTYEDNTEVGTATVQVIGLGDKYAGTKTATFKITGRSIKNVMIAGVKDLTYNGAAQEQNFAIKFAGEEPLVEGRDYTVKYSNNKNAGTATMTINGIGAYTDTLKKTFKIAKKDIGRYGSMGLQTLNGAPEPDGYYGRAVWYAKGGKTKLQFGYIDINGVKLVEGKDYTTSYANLSKNITPLDTDKKPVMRLKGKGNYTGTLEFTYIVVKSDLSRLGNGVTMTVPDVVYSSTPGKFMSKPVLTDYNGKKLKAGVDYDSKNIKYYLEDGTELTKDSVVEAGQTVRVVVTGKGYYTGSKEATYRVTQADIKNAKFEITPQVYTGYVIRPWMYDFEVAKLGGVDLIYGEDYEIVGYKNNVNKGTATVTVRGLGNYGGEKTVKFKIVAKEMIWFWKMFD